MKAISLFLTWDLRIARSLHKYRFPPVIDVMLKIFTRIGDGWIWGIVALLMYLTLPLKDVGSAVLEALLSAALSLPVYFGIKLWIRRARPYKKWLAKEARIDPLDEFSFPSGHTMNNLAVSLALAQYQPWVGGSAAAMALCWGLLRVHYGVHYLSDVLGGALFAACCVVGAHMLNMQIHSWFPNLPV